MTNYSLKKIIWITLSVKLLTFLLIFLAFSGKMFCSVCHDQVGSLNPLTTWDANHYLHIAQVGYQANNLENAFYPLFPGLLKFITPLFSGNSILAGIMLNVGASIFIVILFWLIVKQLTNTKIAFVACCFLLFFPTAFYFHLIYTEVWFLLLTFLAFYGVYKKNIFLILLSGILLPLIRPLGFLVLMPVLYALIFENKKGSKNKNYIWLTIGAFGCGLLLYFLIMFYFTSSPFSGLEAQKYFISNNNLSNLWHPWRWLIQDFFSSNLSVYHLPGMSIWDRIFFLFFCLSLIGIYKTQPKSFFIYALIFGLLPALLGNLMSYPRYLLVVFPLFIFLAQKLEKKYLWLLVPFGVLQIIFLLLHTMNYWVA
ncbi:MAG: hypothetical protein A2233_02585 [Candidatus Kerfeldbacteria bacterium RIFOXYA2_FULL_38_24]|uniref:Glycosyltransferase RgtA/B/C/D-like domain-containing protein n=1 Tax=Candidatus Kerfeldbacteria bacterium RIFOXYB2_FULL_38_14 TaxID=1798547 RepID=A0A1G2BGB0_9BACT|nr:MAG: hypothetical protein A2319_03165 [Candidatus Kerfeldbacteria bacterium RIFOXYB2_FULL_38_14]OGY88077.1 MAG: hypothetical protein A2233_02585 [Candidatus Kerfeldbacteria bacterium RIFOXYA2_FULL_38_24]OGY89511.1 MAG: hypothetical protein A2458_02985 [Candidatus Kerfeldbacteria bacterium RIFOXYC2_FULL_38_9]